MVTYRLSAYPRTAGALLTLVAASIASVAFVRVLLTYTHQLSLHLSTPVEPAAQALTPPNPPAATRVQTANPAQIQAPTPILPSNSFQLPTPRTSTPEAIKLEFDVASVRPAYNGSFGPHDSNLFPRSNVNLAAGNKYVPTGGVFRAENQQVAAYIAFAYNMSGSEEMEMRAQAPKWIKSMRFDSQARSANPNPTKDELRLMMRALLADRFKLSVHKETRELPVYALVLIKPGKLGPQIRRHPANDETCSTPDSMDAMKAFRMPSLDDGYPAVCGWVTYMMASSGPNIKPSGRNVTMALIASMLPAMGNTGLDRPVIDRTGLTGTFDFALELPFVPGSITETDGEDSSPGLLDGLRDQLGLKLERQKGPVEVYVIDHVEEPSPN